MMKYQRIKYFVVVFLAGIVFFNTEFGYSEPYFGFLGVPKRSLNRGWADYQAHMIEVIDEPFYYRTGFNWQIVDEDKDGGYDFSFYDEYYDKFADKDAVMFLTISPGTDMSSDPRYRYYLAGYTDCIKALVKHFQNKRVVWQLGNEVHARRSGLSDVDSYMDFVKVTADKIRSVDPQAKIIMSGMSGLYSVPWKSLDFFKGCLNAGICEYVNGFDLHLRWFAYNKSPVKTHNEYERIKNALHDFMSEADNCPACQNKEWFITETGTYGGDASIDNFCNKQKCKVCQTQQFKKGEYIVSEKFQRMRYPEHPELANITMYQSERDQALSYARFLPYTLALGINHIFSGEFSDGVFGCPDEIWYYEGLVTDYVSKRHKLAFYTYWLIMEKFDGAVLDSVIQDTDGIYVYKFINEKKPLWVAWNDNDNKSEVTISGITSQKVVITEMVPDALTGETIAVSDYPNFFKTKVTLLHGGDLTVVLGECPLLIESSKGKK